MDAKILTEAGWKANAAKCGIKDNGLQRALAAYEKLDENKFDERIKSLAGISQFAGTLKKSKEAAASKDALKYLGDVVTSAATELGRVNNAKVQAEKTAAAEKAKDAAAKSAADAKNQDAADDETGDYPALLLAAFQKMKSAKDVVFEFIVCDAKPHCGLMISKKISPKHKEELTKVTGGSKHFLPLGTCQFVDGKFDFRMEQAVQGLAKKLQDSIKNFTGKKFPIKVGNESAEDDEKSAAGAAAAQSGQASGNADGAKFQAASELWEKMRQDVGASLDQLKNAVRKAFANDGPKVLAEVEQNAKKIDGLLLHFDHQLSDALKKAHAAKDAAARSAELANARKHLVNHLKFLQSDKMIAHMDANPWNVKTNLKQRLSDTLKHMGEVIHA